MTTTQRLRGSSRAHPCPVCGRNTDDKCRIGAEVVFCYCGERFAPPPGLRPGDTITIDGNLWAVVALDAGYAGNSVAFRPHQPKPGAPPHSPRRARRRATITLKTLHADWKRLRARVHAAYGTLDPEQLTLAEIRRDAAIIAAALTTANNLLPALRRARRDLSAVARLIGPTVIWQKALTYQNASITAWQRHYLGSR